MKISFKGVETEFTPLPEGNYEAVVKKTTILKGKESEEPYVKFEYEVKSEGYTGRRLWVNRSLQPQSLWALKKDLIVLGISAERLEDEEEDIEDILADVISSQAMLSVGVREYQGKYTNEILKVSEYEGYSF